MTAEVRVPDDWNRTVHAGIGDGAQLARYDRTGKWYVEFPPLAEKKRRQVSVVDAAQLALDSVGKPGCYVALGRYGGTRFDSAFRRLRSAAEKACALSTVE